MRIIRTITATLGAVALAGGASIIGAAMEPVQSPTTELLQRIQQPAEDSPRFNCIRHGNRSCGVRLDATPNNGSTDFKRYVIQFDRQGRPVSVKPLGR